MLKKWGADRGKVITGTSEKDGLTDDSKHVETVQLSETTDSRSVNSILKGSTVKGDIQVTCDLELSGDIEGNITAQQDANIVIKGTCKGNIDTAGGNVDIRGEVRCGNITTGGNVSIFGMFRGGEVKSRGKIFVNSEFTGKLEGNEIDVGPNARVKGELLYREHISISRGAHVEANLCQIPEHVKKADKSSVEKVADMKHTVKEMIETK